MEETTQTKIKAGVAIAALVANVCLLFPSPAWAADLRFAPATGSPPLGQTFTVSVSVSSPDQAANGVSGTISFPNDMLEVVGISKSGSIVNLWVQEPSYSNEDGTVSFEGIDTNPGYTGANGKIAMITFRGKKMGTAALRFADGMVLANDGEGTPILKQKGTATFTISEALPKPPPPPEPTPAPPVPCVEPEPVTPPAPTSAPAPAPALSCPVVLDTTSSLFLPTSLFLNFLFAIAASFWLLVTGKKIHGHISRGKKKGKS